MLAEPIIDSLDIGCDISDDGDGDDADEVSVELRVDSVQRLHLCNWLPSYRMLLVNQLLLFIIKIVPVLGVEYAG